MTDRATPAQIVATLAELAPDSQPVVHLDVPASDRVPLPLAFAAVFERTWNGATRRERPN